MTRLSRRSVVAAGAAGLALAAAPWRAGATGYAGALRVRFDVATPEGEAMLAKFARAVALMRGRPVGDPLSWTFQWYTHWVPDNTTKAAEIDKLPEGERALAKELWNTCRAHDHDQNEGLFLPWHRAYLASFERIARKLLDDDAFALPYWDMTDPAKRALPASFLQPAAESNPLWNAERKPQVAAGKPIDFAYGEHSPLNADALDQETYAATDVDQGVCMALDKGVHASVHVLTGTNHGMGAVQWAANDPIFWLLHTDMDRLWVSWLAAGHSNPDTDDWLDTEFVFVDENGQRTTTKVRDVLDPGELGYRYDRLAPVLVALGAAGGAAPETATAAPPPPPPPHRAHARPPGTVGAAPPTVAAAPPPVEAAAPEQASSAVSSHGPVRVGQGGVQVTLAATPVPVGNAAPAPPPPPVGAEPSGRGAPADRAQAPRAAAPPQRPALQAQAPRPSKLYVVIRNLQAKAQPGVLYDVYGKVTANGQTVTARLGSINFFDAVDHGMPGMTMQQSFVSFEVTNTLALLRVPGAKLEITIAPVGTAATNAAPVIGQISLVEKPG